MSKITSETHITAHTAASPIASAANLPSTTRRRRTGIDSRRSSVCASSSPAIARVPHPIVNTSMSTGIVLANSRPLR